MIEKACVGLTDNHCRARENGYALHTPHYSTLHPRLEAVIEPEVFDEVFRPGSEDQAF